VFVGRARELDYLNKRYASGRFEFAVIYGRRRVGKTTLINEFIKDKEAVFYTGIEGNAKENLEGLSKSIYSLSADFADTPSSIRGFAEALEAVFAIAGQRRIVFVIDEFPYLANSYRTISSVLQVLIDKNKDTSKMFLILCGSSLSFMEEQVLGYQSPLFGRRTCQFKILPFEFLEARGYFTKFSPIDLATIYGITGGVPRYMSLMDEDLSVEENIKNNFLEPNAYLFEEPGNLIKQECRNPAQYNSIIRAIANGATKMSEICSKTDLDSTLATSYLSRLISLGVVKKEKPFGSGNTRRAIYVLEDAMFRFWYRFIPDNIAAINRGMPDVVYRKIDISAFMGGVFEDICRQYLWELNRCRKAAIPFNDLGRWWGNDPKKKQEAEIDIVGAGDNNDALFGECKWTNEKVDTAVLDGLVYKSTLFRYETVHYYLFAKTGFTKGCRRQAEELGNVTLVTFEDMF